MSRPQFNQQNEQHRYAQAQQQVSGVVVNGGLIDFQDNSHRGVPGTATDYHSNQAAAYLAHMQQQSPLPLASPATLAAMYAGGASFVQPGQPMPATLQQGFHSGATHPGGANTLAQVIPQTTGGACFSGPPTFLHVNGITYKPVDALQAESLVGPGTYPAPSYPDPSQTAGVPTSGGTGSTGNVTNAPANHITTKILSEDEMNNLLEERVASKVESYLSARGGSRPRNHHHHESTGNRERDHYAEDRNSPRRDRGDSPSSSYHPRSTSSSTYYPNDNDKFDHRKATAPRSGPAMPAEAHDDAEIYAAKRVHSAIASMPAPSSTTGSSSGNRASTGTAGSRRRGVGW
jgi:uncharacterized membrane protein (UPF0136 family)